MGSDQKRVFLAVILSGLVLFSWQAFFAPKKPIVVEKKQVEKNIEKKTTIKTPLAEETINSVEFKDKKLTEKLFTLRNNQHQVVISNYLEIKDFINPQAKFLFTEIVGSDNPFQVNIKTKGGYARLNFDFVQSSANRIEGRNTLGVSAKLELDEEGRLHFSFDSSSLMGYQFVLRSTEKSSENRQIRQYVSFAQEVERYDVGDDDTNDGKFKWFGIDYNFHIFNIVLAAKEGAKYDIKENGSYRINFGEGKNNFAGYLIFTQKNYDRLASLGDNLKLTVDFGVFGIIAVPILRGLQFFYKFIPNYGVAIILLTILIRLLLFPLAYKSYKSMKKMQKVQPQLQKLKEKHKDDPQRMQKETMELFKRAGANPLGGCLPLLLQMPVFFAFYQVLYGAVELVGAPLGGWIHDLSIKDPLYILPVLMCVSMFGQHKLTPATTADPTQKKVMMIMPLVFGFIMKDLPSGLVLYIFVSTLFAILQQLFVYKTVD